MVRTFCSASQSHRPVEEYTVINAMTVLLPKYFYFVVSEGPSVLKVFFNDLTN